MARKREISIEERSNPIEKALKRKNYKGAVTFLDVLGWKGIWKERIAFGDKSPINMLAEFIEQIQSNSENLIKPYKNILIDERNPGKDVGVTVLSISDTIVFFTPGLPKETLDIHTTLCSWVLEEAMKQKLPLRGAISYGEYDYKDNIMIGPAVDEAASWHESTDWIGVVLTPSAKFALQGDELPKKIAVYNKIPFKKQVKGLDLCVDWKYTNDLYANFNEKGPHMQEVAPKYLNTLMFLERNIVKKGNEKTSKNIHRFLKAYRLLLKTIDYKIVCHFYNNDLSYEVDLMKIRLEAELEKVADILGIKPTRCSSEQAYSSAMNLIVRPKSRKLFINNKLNRTRKRYTSYLGSDGEVFIGLRDDKKHIKLHTVSRIENTGMYVQDDLAYFNIKVKIKESPDARVLYITDELPHLHGKTATLKRSFSHSGTTTATLPI